MYYHPKSSCKGSVVMWYQLSAYCFSAKDRIVYIPIFYAWLSQTYQTTADASGIDTIRGGDPKVNAQPFQQILRADLRPIHC